MILLTGGTGFVGRHVLARLLADGHPVRVMCRSPERVPAGVACGRVAGDLSDEASLCAALDGVLVVVHAAAALPGPGVSDAELLRINGDGTGRLARMAARAGVRRLIHISSAAVYGDRPAVRTRTEDDPLQPENAYQRSKLAAEHAVAEGLQGSAVRWTVLRPAGLFGADRPATQSFFREVARRRVWLHGPASSRLQPTHVDDLVQAVALALERTDLHAESINVGGARSLSYRELIALVGERLGRVPLQLGLPAWTRGLAARLGGRAGTDTAVDIGKARRLLGFDPQPLEAALDATVAALRRQGVLS